MGKKTRSQIIKKLCFLVIFPSLFIFFPGNASSAEEEFSISYFVTYDFTAAPRTKVNFQIDIENLTNKSYIREYILNIASKKPADIEATDRNGQLPFWVDEENGVTKVKTYFNDKVVGKGALRQWDISYIDGDVGQKNGLVWNVTVPKFKNIPTLNTYSVKLIIPDFFGPEIYSSPQAAKIEKTGRNKIYYFDGEDLKNSGALLNFGQYQLYQFELKYHLRNPNLLSSEVRIALPPNIRGEQQIYLKKILPPPANTFIDEDGNLLAVFKLNGNQETTVIAEGYARVTHPKRDLRLSGKPSEIPKSFLEKYLKSQTYWESEDAEIKKIVGQYAKADSTVSETARSLFNFTIGNLKYSEDRISSDLTRFGAKKALQNRENAVCMEFADLLTTLLRASGIPAQVLEGYAFTEDEGTRPVIGDILHSWVRYYDPRIGWVSVDPTWAATSGLDYFGRLDTNHLVFAIKGMSSTYPLPAGSYKLNPAESADIKVNLNDFDVKFPSEQIEMGVSLKKNPLIPFFLPKARLLIINRSGRGIFDSRVEFSFPGASTSPTKIKIGDLPAYSNRTADFTLQSQTGLPKVIPAEASISFTDFDGGFKNLRWREKITLSSNLSLFVILSGIAAAICLSVFLFLLILGRVRKI